MYFWKIRRSRFETSSRIFVPSWRRALRRSLKKLGRLRSDTPAPFLSPFLPFFRPRSAGGRVIFDNDLFLRRLGSRTDMNFRSNCVPICSRSFLVLRSSGVGSNRMLGCSIRGSMGRSSEDTGLGPLGGIFREPPIIPLFRRIFLNSSRDACAPFAAHNATRTRPSLTKSSKNCIVIGMCEWVIERWCVGGINEENDTLKLSVVDRSETKKQRHVMRH